MELIDGIYKDDLDIYSIHNWMIKRFKDIKKTKLPVIKNKIKQLEKELETPQFLIEKKIKLKEIDKLKLEELEIETNSKEEEYISRTGSIISNYCNLPRLKKQIIFTNSGTDIIHDENYSSRQVLIYMYISILRNYINVDIIRHIYHNDIIRNSIEIFSTSKDINQDIPIRNNYENRENFKKAMYKYQCKEDVIFPSDLYTNLDLFFTKYSMPIGSEVRKMNVNHEWHFDFTSKELLFKALAEIGYNSYYKYFYTICHEYWGWHVRDISGIEEEIMEEYDVTQRIYERIKGKFKKKISSMNVQYRLLRHLKKKKHLCEVRDFKIIKTQDILDCYEEIWKIICHELDWSFEHIF